MSSTATRPGHKPALRAGGTALMLLATPLNVEILRGLQGGVRSLQELRKDLGLPPQSTMRLHLRSLGEIGVIERRSRHAFPTSVDYEITQMGRALLAVGDSVDAWLQTAPGGGKQLGTTGAKSSIKALVEGWSSHLIRVLAARPLSLTELNSLIPRISYPSLERRLAAMRDCGLVEMEQGTGRMKPYKVTPWLRRGVAPVTAAMAWERSYTEEATAGIGRLDVEAAFLLAVPLLYLSDQMTGTCRLAVEVHDGASPVYAGVLVRIEEGEVTSCIADLEGEAEAWISGKPLTWLRQATPAVNGNLEVGGDGRLARSVLEGLRRTAGVPL